MQYSFRMWLGTLEMTVHVARLDDAMQGITWMTKEPIIVRVTVEVNDPSAGSTAVRTVHVADYAVGEWCYAEAWRVAEQATVRTLQHSMESIAPTVDMEV